MAILDSFRVNGTDYDLRDSNAVRFNESQNLTEAQKAQARENIGATAGAVLYDSQQALTDGQKAVARNNIDTVSNDDFDEALNYYTETDVAISAAPEGWNLDGTGKCVQSSTYKLVKYAVTPGDRLHLKLSKDSGGVYQWQNAASVPSSLPNNNLVGAPATTAIDGNVTVPTGATYLIVSQLKANSTNSVKLVTADGTLKEKVTELEEIANGAVLYDVEQSLTDEQKAVTRRNISAPSLTDLNDKVAINQGASNAGKALIVGADGNVALGERNISAEVSSALLELFRHVVYTDETGKQYYDVLYELLIGDIPTPVLDFTVYSSGAADHFTGETPVEGWVNGYFTDDHAARVALVAQTGTHPMTDTDGSAMAAYPIPIPSGAQSITIGNLDSIYIFNCAIYRYDAASGKWKRYLGGSSAQVAYQDERTVDLTDYSDGSYYCVITISLRSSYSEGVPAPYGMNDTAHRIDNVDFSAVTLEFDSEEPAPTPVGPVVVNATISPCEVPEYFSADTPDAEGWYNAYYDAKSTYVGRTAVRAATGTHPMTSTTGDTMSAYPIPIPSGATTLTVAGLDSDLEYCFIVHKYDATAQKWKRRANDVSSLWKMASEQATDISDYGDGTYSFMLNIAKYSGSQGDGAAGKYPAPYGYTASNGDITGRDMSGVTITIGFDAE